MSKPIIRSYSDLLKEQERLRFELDVHKETLNNQVQAIKQKLAPVGTILGAIGSITAAGAASPLLKSGVGLVMDMFIKKRMFKNSGLITGLLGSFLLRNVAGKVVAGTAGVLLTKAFSMFKNRNKKEPKPV